MTRLRYIVIKTGQVLDTVSVPPGEGAITYADGPARRQVESILRRTGGDRAALAGWSNGYVALRA